jgi:hypothetical protein
VLPLTTVACKNIYMHTRLTMKDVLKDFLKKGEEKLIELKCCSRNNGN